MIKLMYKDGLSLQAIKDYFPELNEMEIALIEELFEE